MNRIETQQKVAVAMIKIWDPAWLALRYDNTYIYKVLLLELFWGEDIFSPDNDE
ncbi:MAG: hypothetical protein LBP59_15770 [Planctomycetaceae bacterium]|jgi:hypothetical protein|nr:hypothetical protein [Planctomycetaceae bacterium]